MTDTQFEILREEIQKSTTAGKEAKDASEKLHALWDKDRTDFSNFKLALETNTATFNELREFIIKLPADMKLQIAEALKPAEQSATDLKDAIDSKKIIAIDTQKAKKGLSWWQKIRLKYFSR